MMEMQKNQVKKSYFPCSFSIYQKNLSCKHTNINFLSLFLFLRYDNNAVSWYSLMNLRI